MEAKYRGVRIAQIKDWLNVVLFLVVALIGISCRTQVVQAADISSNITGISGQDARYNSQPIDPTEVAKWDQSTSYELSYHFTIKPGTQVKAGDTATVSLPTGTKFQDDQDFDLPSPDGTIVAHFSATTGASSGQLTFTNYFTTHNNNMTGSINLFVNGEVSGGGKGNDSYILKNGFPWSGQWSDGKTYPKDANQRYQYVEWDVKINPNNKSLSNVVVTDNLQNTGSQELMPDTLTLQWDDGHYTPVPIRDYSLIFSPASGTPTSFTLNWKGTLNKAVNLLYLAKVTDSAYRTTGSATTLNNEAKITGNDAGTGGGGGAITDKAATADAYVKLGGNGNGGGTVYNVNVKKLWENVPTGVTTPAIEAQLYSDGKATNQIMTLNHDNNYSGTFKYLSEYDANNQPIKYTVAEVNVPTDYTGTTTPQPLNAKDNTATLVNRYSLPATTSIKVNKVWAAVPTGTTPPSITAVLYKNGQATQTTVTLSASNQYSAQFTDLPVTDSTGKPISYSVAEEKVPTGYKSTTVGPQPVNNGIVTLKNTYVPTIPVTPDTPITPNTPVTPDTPVTPITPNTPVTPSTPSTPATPGTPNKPVSPKKPKKPTMGHKRPNTKTTTTSQASLATKQPTPKASTDSETPAVSSSGKLPQTSDNKKQALVVSLVGMILLSFIGIAAVVSHKFKMN